MAATDLVPCFYTGQNYRAEKPAEILVRSKVREFKKLKLGKFVDNGTKFLFSHCRIKKAAYSEGPIGRGNLIPFARTHTLGEPLHYAIPMAGDIGLRRHGLFRRRNEAGVFHLHTHEIRVSARSLFSKQDLRGLPIAIRGVRAIQFEAHAG
jgi:hypothetical protein